MSPFSDRDLYEYDPDDEYSDEYDADDEEALYFESDCAMDRNGLCGKAGSEECDFECPFRNMKRN